MARKFTLRSRVTPESVAFLRELNDEQREAATAPGGPILIIAGAVIVALDGGVLPWP